MAALIRLRAPWQRALQRPRAFLAERRFDRQGPIRGDAGIDRVLSETDLITGSVATAIEHDAIRHAMLLGDGSAIAFEVTVPEGSGIAGHTVMTLAALPASPSSCVVGAVYQADGRVEAPRGSSVVQVGTTLLLVSRVTEVAQAVKLLTEPGPGRRP